MLGVDGSGENERGYAGMSAKSMMANELSVSYRADYLRKLKDCAYWMNRAMEAEARLKALQKSADVLMSVVRETRKEKSPVCHQ